MALQSFTTEYQTYLLAHNLHYSDDNDRASSSSLPSLQAECIITMQTLSKSSSFNCIILNLL